LINDPNDPDRVDATKKADSKDGPATPVQTLFGTAGTEFYKKTDCENGSPFHGAKTVGELQEERRKVSGGTEAGKSGKGCCGGGCDIM
jgi:hypothetical protein